MDQLEKKGRDAAFLVRLLLCLIGLATILPLLGYLYGIVKMNTAALTLLLPVICIYILTYWWACKHSTALKNRFDRGVAGGLMGVAGYDLIRIPFHLGGLNPFAAIQSYGVFLAGAEYSNIYTDWLGLFYHMGNGIFFGIMFTMIMGINKGTAVMALVWALVIEGLAIVTVFGEVYHLRSNSTGMAVAFFAHLFYGAPLAWFAKSSSVRPLAVAGSALVAGIAVFSVWVLVRPPDGYLTPYGSHDLQIVEQGIHPRWSRIDLTDTFRIQNMTRETVVLEHPFSDRTLDSLDSGESIEFSFKKPGLYQIRAQRTDWRSVFVAVEKGGFVNPRANGGKGANE